MSEGAINFQPASTFFSCYTDAEVLLTYGPVRSCEKGERDMNSSPSCKHYAHKGIEFVA